MNKVLFYLTRENDLVCYDVIGELKGCVITFHALFKINEHRKMLKKRGIDDKLLCYCIERVCKNPNVFHSEERRGKEAIYHRCFNICGGYYTEIVYKVGSVIIITEILTTSLRKIIKRCGSYEYVK